MSPSEKSFSPDVLREHFKRAVDWMVLANEQNQLIDREEAERQVRVLWDRAWSVPREGRPNDVA